MTDLSQLEQDSRIRTTALVILTFIAVAVALYFLRPVLLPFVLALFIASGLVPILNAVQRYLESSRPVAIAVTAVLSVAVTVVIWSVIAFSVSELRNSSADYNDGFKHMLARVSTWLTVLYPKPMVKDEQAADEPAVAVALEEEQTVEVDPVLIADDDGELVVTTTSKLLQDIDARIKPLHQFFAARMNSILMLVGNELVTVLSSGLLVMIFLFFLLLGGSDVEIPDNNIWHEIDAQVRQYIVAKTVISAITGLAFGAVLWVFGVPLAFVLGMLAFLLNFIPNLGPIIASLLPVPLVWMGAESSWVARQAIIDAGGDPGMDLTLVKAITVVVLASCVQFVSGNIVEPKIMGNQFRLHPIAILLSLMFWYMIWGLVGAFLAVPITSALKVMFAELESTRPAADLLEGNLKILTKREQPEASA